MTTAVQSETFTGDDFRTNASLYNQTPKLRRAYDAMVACGIDNIDDTVAHIRRVDEALKEQSENGAGFTPAKELEFGSENAASIADALRGKRPNTSKLRSLFAKVGS